MRPFSTEFPVKSSMTRASFVADIITWLEGMQHSTILASRSDGDLDKENAYLRSTSGEELRIRELILDGNWQATGFRHDYPDDEGRLWRTEGVLKKTNTENGSHLIRFRSQCLAKAPEARLHTPKKPFLIKNILKKHYGDQDGHFIVSDQPIWLGNTQNDLLVAHAIIRGNATNWLPTVYISANNQDAWSLSQREIEKLAYDLGGIVHIVVEPSRSFSFNLRDVSNGRNVYDGAIGLFVPGQGMVKRYLIGWYIQDKKELLTKIKMASWNIRAYMPSRGWDWTELQEQALRSLRERESNRLSSSDIESIYQEEIENLQDKIQELQQQITLYPQENIYSDDGNLYFDNLVNLIGPEIYAGEISDRLRFSAKTTLSCSEQIGLDKRSKIIFQRIIERLPTSSALSELLKDLDRATKDAKHLVGELSSLLIRHGYQKKSNNKHVKFEPKKNFDGLENIIVSKTPSDNRSLKNTKNQIERTLGINKINF